MFKVKLTRVTNGSALRTNEVVGVTDQMPEVGLRFVMFAAPITEGAIGRLVETSPVKELVGSFGQVDEKPMMVLFETENSTYRIDVLE